MRKQTQIFYPDLQKYSESLPKEFAKIPNERKENLQKIADFIKNKYSKNEIANLTVICTHNSRRSQFGQVWAKIASIFYGFDAQKIQTFSGGTEATACDFRTVLALQRVGVKIEKKHQIEEEIAKNPHYEVRLSEFFSPFSLFSKKYDDAQNLQADFCAILVCSSADEACPMVFGATQRIYHGYEDPKRADNQANESEIYDQTCRLIACEMFYVFSIA